MNDRKTILHSLLFRLGVYLLAVAVSYLLASIFATRAVVSSLAGMGVEVSLADQLTMTVQDLAGMAGMFLPMVAFALLIAFLTAALLCRWWGQWRTPLYVLAGAVGMVTIHLMLNLAFAITPIAAARTTGGLIMQALAGAVGAYLYIYLRNPRRSA
jgi:hypothetical protein